MPLAAFDGAARAEGESDWAYALRWSGEAGPATVLKAMQTACAHDAHAQPGAASDSQPQSRRGSFGGSLGDASALAAAARRTLPFGRGKVDPAAPGKAAPEPPPDAAHPAAPPPPTASQAPSRPPRAPKHRRSISAS
jgi:hypothetical protein